MATTEIIDEALDALLSDQRGRLSARTMRNYEDVVDLLRDSLNGYGPTLWSLPTTSAGSRRSTPGTWRRSVASSGRSTYWATSTSSSATS